jgi:hypothetical protein
MHNYRITSTLWLYQELSYFILDTPNETRRHSLENQDIDSNKEKNQSMSMCNQSMNNSHLTNLDHANI